MSTLDKQIADTGWPFLFLLWALEKHWEGIGESILTANELTVVSREGHRDPKECCRQFLWKCVGKTCTYNDLLTAMEKVNDVDLNELVKALRVNPSVIENLATDSNLLRRIKQARRAQTAWADAFKC